MSRRPIIAGNWKMNYGRPEQALDFVRQIRSGLNELRDIDVVLAPPFTALYPVAELLAPTRIGLAAQDGFWEVHGAHTGEISLAMFAAVCDYVILGHSERRATMSAHETDESINQKLRAALELGLTPILCLGENLEQNESGLTEAFVSGQVRTGLAGLTEDEARSCVIAYEPIWAIGTGRAATPADANRVIGVTVRGAVADLFGEDAAQAIRVQYGGSVNAENIADYMQMPDVDGALVGGASLNSGFVELAGAAERSG